MNKIREKIMQTNFLKAFKRLLITALCVVILGGGTSAFLLRTQIREAAVYVRQEERRGNEHDGRGETEDWHKEDGEGREQHDTEHPDLEHVITRPSAAARAAAGMTGMLCFLMGVAFWLLVAAWLYQAAVLAGMHGFLWFVLGLCGNVGAAALFLLARSLIRKKCEVCGDYQSVGAQYCTRCGAALSVRCSKCGAVGGKDDCFCHSCGEFFSKE